VSCEYGFTKKSDFYVFTFIASVISTINIQIVFLQKYDRRNNMKLDIKYCTVIRFVSIIAKFAICNLVELNGTLVEGKIQTWD